MNSYQLVSRLKKIRVATYLSTADQALYHELIYICNEQKWQDVFNKKNSELCFALNMSEKTLIKSRRKLCDAGLIRFRSSKDKRIGCYYSLSAVISSVVSSADDAPPGCLSSVDTPVECTDEPRDTPIKENIETLNGERCAASPPTPLKYPFGSARFMAAWDLLRRTPKWKNKQNYALQLSLDKLGRFEEEFAVQQMERAIESNWTGVVFADTEDKYQEWLKRKNGKSNHPQPGPAASQSAAQRKESVSQLTELAGNVLRAIAAEKLG